MRQDKISIVERLTIYISNNDNSKSSTYFFCSASLVEKMNRNKQINETSIQKTEKDRKGQGQFHCTWPASDCSCLDLALASRFFLFLAADFDIS